MGEVDASFIQAIEHRPKLKINEAEGIPLIDLSISDTELLVSQIGDACKKWGFFQVVNHGVPLELRERIKLASRKFFAQPKEEKMKVRRNEVNPLGYFDTDHTKNVRDWKEVFDFWLKNPTIMPVSSEPDDEDVVKVFNQWPEYPPDFRETCEEYLKEVEKLGYKLLEFMALSLGLEANRFHGFFEDSSSFIRVNHYPPCPVPDQALGVGRHKDSGALTVLAQDDVGGLEVKRKSDGEWIRVKPTTNAYIINVGDITQVWTNEKYESVEHRAVVNSQMERFSIPFFLGPSFSTMVEPLNELTDEENPAKYKAYNWGKYFAARKGINFKKFNGANLQISHFKISK